MNGKIIRPAAFASTPARIQARYGGGAEGIIILPVIRIERRRPRPATLTPRDIAINLSKKRAEQIRS